MAETTLISTIKRSSDIPTMIPVSAPDCCGVLTLKPGDSFTEQMRHELPTITVAIYIKVDDGYSLYESRAMSISVSSTLKPVSCLLTDIPTSCVFGIIPNFDRYALLSHNEDVETDCSDKWTSLTEEFPIQLIWNNAAVVASEGSGGGSGVTEMPEPDKSIVGQIVQYVGATTPEYVQGYFYICVETDDGYVWANIKVQPDVCWCDMGENPGGSPESPGTGTTPSGSINITFRGLFSSLDELKSQKANNNDYGIVISTDENGNTIYNRYKYNVNAWVFEYGAANNLFTSDEWAAIKSGVTSEVIDNIDKDILGIRADIADIMDVEIPNIQESLEDKIDKITIVSASDINNLNDIIISGLYVFENANTSYTNYPSYSIDTAEIFTGYDSMFVLGSSDTRIQIVYSYTNPAVFAIRNGDVRQNGRPVVWRDWAYHTSEGLIFTKSDKDKLDSAFDSTYIATDKDVLSMLKEVFNNQTD